MESIDSLSGKKTIVLIAHRLSTVQNEKSFLIAHNYSQADNRVLDLGVKIDWLRLHFNRVKKDEDLDCSSTRGLFMWGSDFLRLGGFYPKLLPHYASDYEFTIRARRKGIKIITDQNFKLWGDEGSTGIHFYDNLNTNDFLKKYFTKRSVGNPFYWTSFILLACPWKWKLLNLIRIWKNAIKLIIKKIFFCKKNNLALKENKL